MLADAAFLVRWTLADGAELMAVANLSDHQVRVERPVPVVRRVSAGLELQQPVDGGRLGAAGGMLSVSRSGVRR